MTNQEVDDALMALWVLVREDSPVIIGSQSLHGKYPDVVNSIEHSRAVHVILPNKAKLGNWLNKVVGDGTLFEVDRGYVIRTANLPILAQGWQNRAIKRPLLFNGEQKGIVTLLSPEDMCISKLGAGRDKDFIFLKKLIGKNLVCLKDIAELIPLVPDAHRNVVTGNFKHLSEMLVLPITKTSISKKYKSNPSPALAN